MIDPGDEVVLFDPSYEGCIRMAGGIPVYVALDPSNWSLDLDKFLGSFTGRTKPVILNRLEGSLGGTDNRFFPSKKRQLAFKFNEQLLYMRFAP
ncbi:uncharacterized protein LOC110659249 isoform X2 [Hevea brasiliensis]|uniref:uncharacterized protein LOC110659249 isoform X1 n=1 Tax=Hevea brasiliensis TaxID=3981 RepID=UPI0025FA3F31|nr:uncharacterized protein LOC110659249 isoform X1 [Hevea brasiliensis]XP_057995253.1 uncharacterized protein LOC110659249 isoform X2 [Hevea brasiliensis]